MDEDEKRPLDDKKVKFRKKIVAESKREDVIWVLLITVISFFASVALTVLSSDILKEADIVTAFLVILLIILINILFDIVGIAATAADETPFHAMASRKIFGARQCIKLIRNADKVSNLCNDVIGDICGIISGAAGAYIVFRIIGSRQEITIIELVVTGCITAFTVGGKSLGKILAIRNSSFIVYRVGVIIHFIVSKFRIKKRKGKNRK